MSAQPQLFLRGSGPAAAFCAAVLARKAQLTGSGFGAEIECGALKIPLILGPESLRVLHGIGIDERDLMKACRGTYALGTIYHVGDKPATIPVLSGEDTLDGIPLFRICASEPDAESEHGPETWTETGIETGTETGTPSLPAYAALYPSTYLAETDRMAHPSPPHDYQYCVVLDPNAAFDYFMRAARHYGMRNQPPIQSALIITAFEPAHEDIFTISQTASAPIRSRVVHHDRAQACEISLSTQVCELTLRAAKAALAAATPHAKPDGETSDVLQHIMSRLLPFDRLYYDALSMSLEEFYQFWPVGDESGMALHTIAARSARRADLASDFQRLHWLCDERAIMSRGSDALQGKCALFIHRGHIPLHEGEIVNASEWAMRFASLGIKPKTRDPLAAPLNMEEMGQALIKRRADARGWASQQMSQTDYLGKMGALIPASTARRAQ